jgi:hypothetical protein
LPAADWIAAAAALLTLAGQYRPRLRQPLARLMTPRFIAVFSLAAVKLYCRWQSERRLSVNVNDTEIERNSVCAICRAGRPQGAAGAH